MLITLLIGILGEKKPLPKQKQKISLYSHILGIPEISGYSSLVIIGGIPVTITDNMS